jgi:hypothetical protein
MPFFVKVESVLLLFIWCLSAVKKKRFQFVVSNTPFELVATSINAIVLAARNEVRDCVAKNQR